MVAAPLLDSSSGWACTAIKRNPVLCSASTITGTIPSVSLFLVTPPRLRPTCSAARIIDSPWLIPTRCIDSSGGPEVDSQQPSDGSGGTVPEGRYGPGNKSWRDRFRPRTRKALIAVPLAVVLGLLGFLMYTNLGSESIEADRTSFREVSDQAMELNMRVRRDDPDRPAVCVERTRALNGVESGRVEVIVASGQS